jgi:hypothetical protein
VTVRPDGSYHVWSDFFLEQYGWVPVDVTYKNSNPSGDFFGKYDGNGIVMTKGVALQMDRGDGFTYIAELLQTYQWWYWCSTPGNSVSSSHHISSVTAVASYPDRSLIGAPCRDRKCDQWGVQNGLLSGMIPPAASVRWFTLKGQTVVPWSWHRDQLPLNTVGLHHGVFAAEGFHGGNRSVKRVMLP